MLLPKNYLKYLIKFYAKCGLDVDYIDKLNTEQQQFLCRFILENYGGVSDDIAVKKRANHHRYATRFDALIVKAVPSSDCMLHSQRCKIIDPETYLITKEFALKKLKK
jgi:hypothetical protein